MTQTLANRTITVPQQSFLNCVSLSIQEEDLNTSELDGLHGGNPRLFTFVLENIPRVYNQAQQAINRGMPPVIQATLHAAEQIVDDVIDTGDRVIDEVSQGIEEFELDEFLYHAYGGQ